MIKSPLPVAAFKGKSETGNNTTTTKKAMYWWTSFWQTNVTAGRLEHDDWAKISISFLVLRSSEVIIWLTFGTFTKFPGVELWRAFRDFRLQCRMSPPQVKRVIALSFNEPASNTWPHSIHPPIHFLWILLLESSPAVMDGLKLVDFQERLLVYCKEVPKDKHERTLSLSFSPSLSLSLCRVSTLPQMHIFG